MTPLLEARSLRKAFPGVQALDGVSLRLMPGEALAVVGENGAGKSTLMKIVAGLYRPDEGELLLDGKPFRPRSVADSMERGVVLIHQELNLAENLSIEANLFLGRERTGPLGWLLPGSMRGPTVELLRRVGLDAPPSRLVGSMAPGQRQMVEIARALSMNARLIIMDEPTSSLTQSETDKLYEVCDGLKRDGVAVLYISHRLAEVRRIASRVVVLRDGRNAGELAGPEITHDHMVRLMVGRDLRRIAPSRQVPVDAPPGLELRGLEFEGGGPPVSLSVRGGEIVGMAGLVGAGRTELAEAMFGLRRVTAGELLVGGKAVRLTHPRDAIAAGLVLVPEDRRKHGLVITETVGENLALPNWAELSTAGFVRPDKVAALCQRLMERLQVRTHGPGQVVGQLSGGNQQKVVLGKWMAHLPLVLVLDEPTRGVDVGARSEIYALMDELACRGVAILMISSDLEEVLGVSGRVLVMHEGRLAGGLSRDEMTEEAVMQLATGGGGS